MERIRLDKYLCDLGKATRSESKKMIRSGRVRVDGETVTAPETKIAPDSARVTLDGEKLLWAKHHYYMMNKPAGILTATEDRRQKTVLDLLPDELRRMELFPVGRLDRDTRGLLLSRARPTRATQPPLPGGSYSATGRSAAPLVWRFWGRAAASSR